MTTRMTKEEIINIAWNIFPISDREKNEAFIELLVHFAQAIAEKEREECANLCYKDDRNNAFTNAYNGKRLDLLCSELIRARGQE
jgi:hypothetical protein